MRKSLESLAKKSLRKKIELCIAVFLFVLTLALPLSLGTKAYPVAVVAGNSMYPTLQNGDMVLFKAVNTHSLPNGTIIVFVQSDTGISSLDTLIKPIIIHRIVGSFIQADGNVYYLTKGDNNNLNDPSAVAADHILGMPVQVIPRAGIILLFLSSPQGLVATIGFITLFYLSYYETKLNGEKTKETFLGTLAQMVLTGALPEEVFRKFEIAVKYVTEDELDQLKGGLTQALEDWMRKLAIEKGWTVKDINCPVCSSEVTSFEISKDERFIACPRCLWRKRDLGNKEKTTTLIQ